MASLDKLIKALEALKVTLTSSSTEEKQIREKVSHALTVTEHLCSPEVRSAPSFSNLLSSSMETLLYMCDDNDSDVRMMADECLNRIIRANMSTMCNTILKIYVELHKEIKKNGKARSLRAALSRFAHLAHMIRPQKGKAYMQSLTPCLVNIAERHEESIFQTLAKAVPKIFSALGPFASDTQIKTLLETLLANVVSDNAVIRRTSATCIAHICLSVPKSQVFFTFVLSSLLDLVIPLKEDTSSCTMLGVLNCVRTLLPHINYDERQIVIRGSFGTKRKQTPQNPPPLDYLFQIFELCLEWSRSTDHNIVTTSLETLHQVLSSAPSSFINQLGSTQASSRSRIHPHPLGHQSRLHKRSLSEMSLASSIGGGDESLIFDMDETPMVTLSSWLSDQQVDRVPTIRSSADHSVEQNKPGSSAFSASVLSLDPVSLDHSIPSISEENTLLDESRNSLWKEEEKPLSPEPSELAVTDSITPPGSPAFAQPIHDKQWDIGELYDGESSAVLYGGRFLVTRFLLIGGSIRVVIKCLAVSCLTQLIRIQPSLFFAPLDRHPPSDETDQRDRICDVLSLSEHQDPQLKGLIRLLCGQLLASSLHPSVNPSSEIVVMLPQIIQLLIKGLTDESTVCVGHSLSSVSLFLRDMLNSDYHSSLIPLLQIFHKTYHNPYWLIKVKLLELICELPMTTVVHTFGDISYQDKIISSILVPALDVPDSRIRKAAASAFVKLVENLYYPIDHAEGDIIVAVSSNIVEELLLPDSNRSNCITGAKIRNNLSRIVYLLSQKMIESTSKYTIYGCVESLCMLSTKYKVIDYPSAWQCSINPSSTSNSIHSGGLLSLTATLLTESSHSIDLECHTSLLILAGNLFYGLSQSFLRHADTVFDPSSLWPNIKDPKVCGDGKTLLQHTLRLLSMLVRMMDDGPKTAGVSPLKRRSQNRAQSPPSKNPQSPFLDKEKREEKNRLVGHFQNIPHCLKLYDLVKSAYNNYRVTLEEDSSEKFLRLVTAVLSCLCDILKPATITSTCSLTEEVLSYLRCVFVLNTTCTIQVVNQLLKCLFVRKTLTAKLVQELKQDIDSGIFDILFGKPLKNVAHLLQTNHQSYIQDKEAEGTDAKQQCSAITLDRTALAVHIKLFEPIVIQALREYTVSSNVHLQVEVLKLLMQLLQLKVNYCLLDSEQIFFKVVLKQFDFLETGQIQNAELLIPEIFQFLAHLSNEKNHSKPVISIPRVIQLCDGLMASGQDPLTHCIPALTPLVEHVFVYPIAGSDAKELETQCEVILAMLLKLAEYPQVLSLLKSIMRYSGDQWKCMYRQTVDTLVACMSRASLHLDRVHTMYVLLNSGPSPSPLPSLLTLLFTPQAEGQCIEDWLGGIAVVLMSICSSKEEAVLLQLDQMSLYIQEEGDDPLNVNTKSKQSLPQQLMAKLLVKVIKNSSLEMEMIGDSNYLSTCSNPDLLYTHFADFIYTVIHMIDPGNFEELSKCLIQILKSSGEEVEGITLSLLRIHRKTPMPLLLWAYILALNDMGSRQMWSNIINGTTDKLSSARLYDESGNSSGSGRKSINSELVRRTGILLYCEYLALYETDEKTNDLEWFLDSYMDVIITNCYEPPVDKMLRNIYLSESQSQILLQHLTKSIVLNKAGFTYRLLHCLEFINPSHSGEVLKHVALTLIQHCNISIARLAVSFCSRTLEYLLTLESEQASLQLSQAQIMALLDLFSSNSKLSKRGSVVVSLLKKLSTQIYGTSGDEIAVTNVKSVDSLEIQSTKLDSAWLASLVRTKCCSLDVSEARLCSTLLSCLEEEDIKKILNDPSFNLSILHQCFHSTSVMSSLPPCLEDTSKQNIVIRLSRDLLFKKLSTLSSIEDWMETERMVLILVPAVRNYLISGRDNGSSSPTILPPDIYQLFYDFALLSLRVMNGLLSKGKGSSRCLKPTVLASLLECLSLIYNFASVTSLFRYQDISFVCDVLFRLVKSLTHLDVPMKTLKCSTEESSEEDVKFASACLKIASLTAWLETSDDSSKSIPTSIYASLREVILRLSLCRWVVYYCRVPVEAWPLPLKFGVNPPPIDVNILHDVSLLSHLTKRISMLRWRARQEFEETWVCLLSALTLNLDLTTVDQESHNEWHNMLQENILVVDAVTWLVLTTLRLSSSTCDRQPYLHVPRLSSHQITKFKRWDRLKELNDLMISKFNLMSHKLPLNLTRVDMRDNIERYDHSNYGIGQLSVAYLQRQIQSPDERNATKVNSDVETDSSAHDYIEKLIMEREKQLADSGIDVRSCVQFLVDLFSQSSYLYISFSNSDMSDIVDLSIVRSILCLSDLFSERLHYIWMLDIFLIKSRCHPPFDHIIHQYLTIGLCKAAAVLILQDEKTSLSILKVLQNSLKSPFPPLRTAGVQGLLYLLQVMSCANSKLNEGQTITGSSETDLMSLLCQLPNQGYLTSFAMDIFILTVAHINDHFLSKMESEEEDCLSIIALVVYVLEHFGSFLFNMTSKDLVKGLMDLAKNPPSHRIYQAAVQGLERVVLVLGNSKPISRLALERLTHSDPLITLPALQLLLATIYSNDETSPSDETSWTMEKMETISILFDRIKKGYLIEVELIVEVVAKVLSDLFPASDILNKVIGEFLSPNQPHKRHMASIVLQCFSVACDEKQLPLLQDWVVHFLNNFSTNLPTAGWCLCCFFISASTNPNLKAIFPLVQSRIALSDVEDRKILCLAALDFYRQLSSKQQEMFKETALSQKGPFSDIITCL